MKGKRNGFTVVELLTALAIIAILVGLLVPSLTMVRNMAKETRQKAQFAAIGQALLAFRADYGDYPPSGARDGTGASYCGAQKLVESLLGQDLLGFHPGSYWQADGGGLDRFGNPFCYPLNPPVANLEDRRGPYLDVATANAFTLRQLYDRGQYFTALTGTQLNPDRFVLCDSFGIKRVTIAAGQTVTAGTPILYYKANTNSAIWTNTDPLNSRYSAYDNYAPCSIPSLKNEQMLHPLNTIPDIFYDDRYKIVDMQIYEATGRGKLWPHRPDSYILISAGADGLYGTADDITNW